MRSKSSKRVTEIRALRTHTQSLSGRSLGSGDRAAALPGWRAAAKALCQLPGGRRKVIARRKTTGVPFRVVIVAASSISQHFSCSWLNWTRALSPSFIRVWHHPTSAHSNPRLSALQTSTEKRGKARISMLRRCRLLIRVFSARIRVPRYPRLLVTSARRG